MRKLNSKKLRTAYKLISEFHYENKSITFDVPSLLQYCLEQDLREILKKKKFNDNQINEIIRNSGFNVIPYASRKKSEISKVSFNFIYNDFETFQNNYTLNLYHETA